MSRAASPCDCWRVARPGLVEDLTEVRGVLVGDDVGRERLWFEESGRTRWEPEQGNSGMLSDARGGL